MSKHHNLSSSLISDEALEKYFENAHSALRAQNNKVVFVWSTQVLDEITLNVERSLRGNFAACDFEYCEAKIAVLYTFWIAKLKPGFAVYTPYPAIHEYVAISIGISIIYDHLGIMINLTRDELTEIGETLRYHTTSPHTMTHIFNSWIEREKLRKIISKKQ